jgi:hypothetical protein
MSFNTLNCDLFKYVNNDLTDINKFNNKKMFNKCIIFLLMYLSDSIYIF